jgi:hypothetical protein
MRRVAVAIVITLALGALPGTGALASELGTGTAGTNIGNAGQLTGSSSGSLASSTSDDWWVIYPSAPGGSVSVTVADTTGSPSSCDSLTASLDTTDGTSQALTGVDLSRGDSQKISGQSNGSDRYFVEVRPSHCEPPSPVTYTLTLDSGGGGAAPSPADGSVAAGTSIGGAWPPLQGKTSYTGTIASSSSDDWYVLYKKPDSNAATVRIEDTTVAGTVSCIDLSVSLDNSNGTAQAVSGANLSDNSAATLSVPGQSGSDTTGEYYLEITSTCPDGGISYRIEPEPGSEWLNPAKLPSGTASPGSSIGDAWPPLQGGTTYDGSVTSAADENWYVLYKKPGTSPVSVRVEDTTIAGSTPCPGITVSLDGADGTGDAVTGADLSDNSAATMTIPGSGSPDYLNRYYLEIQDSGCPSAGATYRIEPEPSDGWANPAKAASMKLPAGASMKGAGGPLAGGVTYDGTLDNGTSQDWVFLDATGSVPLTISVQNTTSNQDNCLGEDVSVLDSGGTVSGADLGDDDEAELVVDSARTYYVEISVAGDCPPDVPLTSTVMLTPANGACSCGCSPAADRGLRPAAGSAFAINMDKPGGGTTPVADKTTVAGVGEPIDLELACAPGGASPTGPYQWELPAEAGYPVTLSSYDIDEGPPTASSRLVKVPGSHSDKFSFYVLEAGVYTVKVTASVNGKRETVPATFDIRAPKSEFTATTCPAALNTKWTYKLPVAEFSPPRLTLGLNNQCVTTTGIAWSAKATLADKVLPEGDLAVVQLVNGTFKHSSQKKACLATKGWEADGGAFYETAVDKPVIKGHTVSGFSSGPDMVTVKAGKSNTLTSSDSPSIWLRNGATWTASLDFTDYLMYRPNYKATSLGHFGIWVALRRLNWSFKASASYNGKTKKWKLGKVTPDPKKIDSVASSAEPEFSSSVQAPTSCP